MDTVDTARSQNMRRMISTHEARSILIAIADEFQNDYVTVAGYASLNGLIESDAKALIESDAKALIELAQRVRNATHPEA